MGDTIYRTLYLDKSEQLLDAMIKIFKLNAIIMGYEKAIQEVGLAYPLDIFPDTTQEERDTVDSGFISRTSAMTGRHIAKVIQERALHFANEILEDGDVKTPRIA